MDCGRVVFTHGAQALTPGVKALTPGVKAPRPLSLRERGELLAPGAFFSLSLRERD